MAREVVGRLLGGCSGDPGRLPRFVSGRHMGEIAERLQGRKLLGGSWEPLRNILGSLGSRKKQGAILFYLFPGRRRDDDDAVRSLIKSSDAATTTTL